MRPIFAAERAVILVGTDFTILYYTLLYYTIQTLYIDIINISPLGICVTLPQTPR